MKLTTKIVKMIGFVLASMIFIHTVKTIVTTFPNGGNVAPVTTEE